MKYTLLIIYLATHGSGWEPTKYREEFDSMKECQAKLASWRASLGAAIKSAQCYYQGNKPLPGDCNAWGEYSRKWTAFCYEKGNDVTARCVQLETPPSPYDKCLRN